MISQLRQTIRLGWIVSTEAICKNFCNLTWNWLIKKNELQDSLLHSQEKVQVILLRSFPNESPNKEEFEFIMLFLLYVRYCKYMLITDVTTKRFFGLFLMKSSRENTFLGLFFWCFARKSMTEDIPYHWRWSARWFEEHQPESPGTDQIPQVEKEPQEEIRILLLLSRDPEKVILHR